MKGWEEGGLVGDAGEGESSVPRAWWRKVNGKGDDAVAVVQPRISIFPCGSVVEMKILQAIISQPSFWCNFAPQSPASEHAHHFLFGILTEHRFGEPEHARIVDCGPVSDISTSPNLCLAAACHDNGVRTMYIGSDAMSGLINDTIAVGSGRLEPPAVRVSDLVISWMIEREWTHSPTSKPRWPNACARDGFGAPSMDQADFASCTIVIQATHDYLDVGYIIRPWPSLPSQLPHSLHSASWAVKIGSQILQRSQLVFPLRDQLFRPYLYIHRPEGIPCSWDDH